MTPAVDALAAALARESVQRSALTVLLAWAIANLVLGAVLGLRLRPGPWRDAARASAAWNVVNLLLAVGGLAGLGTPSPGSAAQALAASASLERILAVNVGLDVAWCFLGGWMRERGRGRGPAWLAGAGAAVAVQGAALLVFDAGFLAAVRRATVRAFGV